MLYERDSVRYELYDSPKPGVDEMPQRTIVKIDEEKCTGCGECVTACAEGALKIVNGKAKLVSESYCDGLGACLGTCPEDAIVIEEREADPFDEEAVEKHMAAQAAPKQEQPFVCPGARARVIERNTSDRQSGAPGAAPSELTQWPVQLTLVPPSAPYFQDAELLLTADCAPFALNNFHERLLRGRAIAIACPKLDDVDAHIAKLTQILEQSSVRSVAVVHMEVPCCFGLMHIAQQAAAACGKEIPIREITVTISGEIDEAVGACASCA